MSEGYMPNMYNAQYNPMMVETIEMRGSPYLNLTNLISQELPSYEESYKEAFDEDENYNPFLEKTTLIRQLAENFLNVIKDKYPNRFFILKKITKNSDLWDLILNQSILVIGEENSVQKLKSVLEVIIFFLIETLRLFFVF